MQENDKANDWSDLRSALELRCAGLATRERVDDAIQDACLALLVARAAGVMIRDDVRWCLVVVRRRIMDVYRRRRREVAGAEMENAPANEASDVDWGRALRDAGIEVTKDACELLVRMTSGYRGNHSLAECLGRDVKTIRERRSRLLGLLRRVFEDFHGVPPPLSDRYVEAEVWPSRADRQPGHILVLRGFARRESD